MYPQDVHKFVSLLGELVQVTQDGRFDVDRKPVVQEIDMSQVILRVGKLVEGTYLPRGVLNTIGKYGSTTSTEKVFIATIFLVSLLILALELPRWSGRYWCYLCCS